VRTIAGRRHQPPPCDALLVVVGAGLALVGAGAGGVVGGASRGVVGAGAGAVGWAAGADGWTAAGFRVGELVTCPRVAACCGAAEAVGVTVGGFWTGAVWAGALRANTTAKPTVASVPSWVARQVSRPSRRTLTSRACPDASSYLSRMSTDLTSSCVKRT
jgi:hypothetical protein